jgi:hypothetical protein
MKEHLEDTKLNIELATVELVAQKSYILFDVCETENGCNNTKEILTKPVVVPLSLTLPPLWRP